VQKKLVWDQIMNVIDSFRLHFYMFQQNGNLKQNFQLNIYKLWLETEEKVQVVDEVIKFLNNLSHFELSILGITVDFNLAQYLLQTYFQ
jgi:hypothetical protein